MPRAVQVTKLGPIKEVLKVVELPPLEPKKGEAVVDVLAAGIELADITTMEGNHAFKPPAPYTLGVEMCGRVKKVGEGSEYAVGQLVFGRLSNFTDVFGGSIAEEAIVPNGNPQLFVAPEGLDPNLLAGLVANYSCSYHGLKDVAQLQKGERLCVLGASGGVGLAAVEIGKAMGATVVACASSPEKLQICQEAGADVLIDYSLPNFKDRIRKEAGGPLDVVYDPVGGEFSEPALRALGFGGRLVVIGFAVGGSTPAASPGAIPRIPLNLALLNERKIMGSMNIVPETVRRDVLAVLEMMKQGTLKIRPPTLFPMERFMDAYDHLAQRKAIGKTVLVASGGFAGAKL